MEHDNPPPNTIQDLVPLRQHEMVAWQQDAVTKESPCYDDVFIDPSRYEELFREFEFDDEGDDKDDLDKQTDEGDDEEELDWMEGRKRGEEEREKAKVCRQCRVRCVTQDMCVECPECHRAMYCSQVCLDKGRTQHLEKCLKNARYKRVENFVNSMQSTQQVIYGRSFGTINDLPGLEHEFLGGSKTNVLLKIGRRHKDLFHCEDIDGQKTKIHFELVDETFIQGLTKKYDDVYITVMGAYLRILPSCQDLGIVVRETKVLFFATNKRDDEIRMLPLVVVGRPKPERISLVASDSQLVCLTPSDRVDDYLPLFVIAFLLHRLFLMYIGVM